MMNIIKKGTSFLAMALITMSLNSCFLFDHSTPTPDSAKYIKDFHVVNFIESRDALQEDALALYVDYSYCIADGQKSPFYQSLVPSFVQATKSYYSIKGNAITKEDLNEIDVYHRLLNIQEVNYADLKTAAMQIANGKTEGVLVTDGEYYENNIAGGHQTDPYLAEPFKKWMQRGHDIFIISEPYQEGSYKKKRFYFLFTDSRIKNNIYDRICETTKLQRFPDVEVFHLSADHPSVLPTGNSSETNPSLAASIDPYGSMEIQDWTVDWEETIEGLIMGAVDEKTGNPLKNGDYVIKGLKIDRNSFGGYKITDIDVMVYDMNNEYMEFASNKEAGQKVGPMGAPLVACPNFLIVDKDEFKRHGNIQLHFDVMNLGNSFLVGNPYNYFKIDFFISETENVFSKYENMFKFDLLGAQNGEQNLSVVESVKQCLTDPKLKEQMKKSPFYTIYVKSNKR